MTQAQCDNITQASAAASSIPRDVAAPAAPAAPADTPIHPPRTWRKTAR
ncbi:hypothetical protein [Burkholderia paludis]|nr:hypothetical protein [Burkholderia paludis]